MQTNNLYKKILDKGFNLVVKDQQSNTNTMYQLKLKFENNRINDNTLYKININLELINCGQTTKECQFSSNVITNIEEDINVMLNDFVETLISRVAIDNKSSIFSRILDDWMNVSQ